MRMIMTIVMQLYNGVTVPFTIGHEDK